jgi:DNA-binding NtrC family response regulator
VDVRVIATTNRELKEEVKQNKFREDLFYRLNVIHLHLPPLRKRGEDLPELARHFVERTCSRFGLDPKRVTADAIRVLQAYPWPGNVRELENVVMRALVMSRGPSLTLQDVGALETKPADESEDWSAPTDAMSLSEVRSSVEREHVKRVLEEAGGNKSQAARVLKISRPTLNRIIEDHHLVVP